MSPAKRLLIVFLFNLFAFFFYVFPTYAQPKDWSGACVGTGAAADVATIQGLECLFFNVLQVITLFAGLAFFIMFIVGGFQYLMSSNDPKAVAQASHTLTMSFLAVLGIILSWFILRFITQFTGINVLNFVIPRAGS